MAPSDPLAQLVDDLREQGRPDLSWVLAWAPEGELSDAWNLARRPFDMLCVLALAGRLPGSELPTDWWLARGGIAIVEVELPDGTSFRATEGAADPSRAALLRRWFPAPPALGRVMDAAGGAQVAA